jgi:hypothetical protein
LDVFQEAREAPSGDFRGSNDGNFGSGVFPIESTATVAISGADRDFLPDLSPELVK